MKTMASAVWVLLLLGASAWAQTLDDLKKDSNGGSTDNVLTYGMGYHQQRYSPLKASQQGDCQAPSSGMESQP